MPSKKKKLKFKIPAPIMYLLAIIALVLIYDVVVGIPLEITTIKLKEEKIILDVPTLTEISSKQGSYITLQSFRSKKALKKDMETILRGYEVIDCDSELYHYNPISNYTITVSQVRSSLIWNYVDLLYEKGKATCPTKEEIESTCHFTRTYYVDQVVENQTTNELSLVLTEYQGSTVILNIPLKWSSNIDVGNNYEFTFSSEKDQELDTSLPNIFNNYELVDITKTDRIGLEQIQDTICE